MVEIRCDIEYISDSGQKEKVKKNEEGIKLHIHEQVIKYKGFFNDVEVVVQLKGKPADVVQLKDEFGEEAFEMIMASVHRQSKLDSYTQQAKEAQ